VPVKYRFYANSSVVLERFTQQVTDIQNDIEALEAEKAKVEKSVADYRILRPYDTGGSGTVHIASINNKLEAAKADLAVAAYTVMLIASHSPPEIMVELED
jgi:hypothetical protein